MKKLKIRDQLLLGFAIIFLLVVILGVVLITQTTRLAEQTTLIYNHPFKVRRAIGELQKNVLLIHRDMKSMILTDDPQEVTQLIALTETYQSDAFKQIDILYNNYLGPVSDVDTIKNEFIFWNTIRNETIQLLLSGQAEEAAIRTQSYGVGGNQANVVIGFIEVVDNFARNKSEEFYQNALKINNESNLQAIIILMIFIVLLFTIYFFLFNAIRTPLKEMISASKRFMIGERDARSQYDLKNEFGELSDSFNEMADSIQQNYKVINKREKFSELLLTEMDLEPFFRMILAELIQKTESQVGAVYLLNEQQQKYSILNSMGMQQQPDMTFSVETKEGEFGLVLMKKEIHHLREIGNNILYPLKTAFGDFKPNEIISMPLMTNNKIPVIISLATIGNYGPASLLFIEEIWKLLNARLSGLLATDKIRKLAEELELQNNELDAQTKELISQAIELNQQNIELDLQKNQLGQANQMKTSFISNMSHELRTPLNSIIALSGVLSRHLENKIPEDEYSYLEVIERNGKLLLDLINDILDISRIESGKEEMEISTFNLPNLINEILSTLTPLAGQKGLNISQKYPPQLSQISSDYKKCRHILQNIISNAIKFTEQGTIDIIVDEKVNQFVIEVHDTGIGIADKDVVRIFEEFRQADETTRRRFGGTGLGLSIAKKYAEMIGGTITVVSKFGEGSTFSIVLPKEVLINNNVLQQLTHEGTIGKPTKSVISEAEKKKLKILIVEDSEPAMIQLQDILSYAGYQTLFAKNGKEALELVFVTKPDAIILDLMMPEVDGFQVLEAIRNDDRTENIPVLVLTAKTITHEELAFLKHNMVYQLIQKGSINRKELLTEIEGMLASTLKKVNLPKIISPKKTDEKISVLVVEDNPDNLLTAKALLKDGYEVIEATDGEMGLELARLKQPDLILLDISLPKMDGIQVINAIRSDVKLAKIKIIALTASAMTEDRETILAHGFDGYIPKPIDHLEFSQTIRQVIYGEK